MIKLQELTPEVYYNHSRDFQFLGRVYDVVLNDIKTNIDLMYNLPLNDDVDTNLIDLVATTLGFKSLHQYDIKQLLAMTSIFSTILRCKGSVVSIELAAQVLLNVQGSKSEAVVTVDNEAGEIVIFLSNEVTDINLLEDLLPYILPVGMKCKISRQINLTTLTTTLSKVSQDKVTPVGGNVSVKSQLAVFSGTGEYTASGTDSGVTDNGGVVPYESGE